MVKRPANVDLLFSTLRTKSAKSGAWSSFGQIGGDALDCTQELVDSSPASSTRKGPANIGFLFSQEEDDIGRNRAVVSFGQVGDERDE
jgi:hypothetical protein